MELSAKSPQSRPRKENPAVRSHPGAVQRFAGVVMRMSLQKLIIIAALGAAGFPLQAAEPSAVGLWEQVDENTGKAESWFKITERSGVYEGAIVKIFFKPGEDENWI